jgi:hypothetical protein
MSDNALCYARSDEVRRTLTELGARHILIPPRTPRWTGKIERFFATVDTEWAHGRVWLDSTRRDRARSSFVRFYTAGDRTPPPAAEPPSPASIKSASRTASPRSSAARTRSSAPGARSEAGVLEVVPGAMEATST